MLRLLSLTAQPLSKAHVAERTSLDPSGVRRAIESLIAHGVVEDVGAGAHRPVRLRDQHPLSGALRTLFRAEAARAQDVTDELRRAARSIQPPPRAVWMVPPDPSREAGALEQIEIGVLASVAEVDRAVQQMRDQVTEIQRRSDVLLDVRPYAMADLAILDPAQQTALSAAIPLLGLPPEAFLPRDEGPPARPARVRDHGDMDRRALKLGHALGDRMVRDPTMIDRAREYVRRYLRNAPPGERKEMEEWLGLLDSLSPQRLRSFLVDPGPRATRLRQSLPFLDVLTQHERETILREADFDQGTA
ncbi:MAG TPA: helix-turn-helix domain-containing protein [Longimicrobium sp.]|nr:helix-turn-helix domain-containing protein [Longimicrobium sp.]